MTFMPPIEFLRERFYIDLDGALRYAKGSAKAKAHDRAGRKQRDGYWYVDVSHGGRRKKLAVHRIVWSLKAGRAVADDRQVDHGDRDRDNNHWRNLKARTVRANQLNKSNAGRGVTRAGNKFRAKISVHGKTIHLGSFDKEHHAERAYRLARAGKHPKCTREVINALAA